MADPKKAGEEADRMIAELAAAKATAGENDSPHDDSIAIPEAAATPPDVSELPSAPQGVSPEVESLRKQVEIANQQWRVLQGMITKKDEDLEHMRELMSKLSTSQPSVPASVETVTDAELKEYGPELVDLITRIARKISLDQVSQMAPKFEELQKSVKGVSDYSQKTAADLFDESLLKRVPDWKDVNMAPAFMTWLQTQDVFSGRTRLDLLNEAYSQMNLDRTAKFFEAYRGDAPAPAASTPAPVKPVPVTPGRSKSGSQPAQADDKAIWTQAAIQKLYSDQRNGRISKEEFDRLERDLFKAQGENRLAA